jgi:hypothetical protein
VACSTAADCSSFGDGYDCVEGRCRGAVTADGGAVTADGGAVTADGGAVACSERTDLAAQRVQDAIDTADKTCATDADCVWASTSSDCNDSCGTVVSVEGDKTLQAAIDELNTGLCASFDADCGAPIALPCVAPGNTICLDGHCAVFGGASALTCDQLAAYAKQQIEAAAAMDLSCSSDADCSYWSYPQLSTCSSSCDPVLVSAQGAASVQAAIDELNTTICTQYQQQQCPPIVPLPCAAFGGASCVNGQCVGGVFDGGI